MAFAPRLRPEFLPMSRRRFRRDSSFTAFFSAVRLHGSILLFVLCACSLTEYSTELLIHLALCFLNILDWMPAPCMQTDKASMLDEIIDYVKFLQLQVKASICMEC
jgi:hypothetical protein